VRYFKFPKWLKRFYPHAIWDFSFLETADQKTIYLTFVVGPNVTTTTWILALLKIHKDTATSSLFGEIAKYHSN